MSRKRKRTQTQDVDFAAAATAEALAVVEILGEGLTGEKAREVATNAAEFFDGTFATPKSPVACGRGCAFCCHLPVAAAVPEVFRIASCVRDDFSEPERAEVLEAIKAYLKRAEGLLDHELREVRIPCPFLRNSECMIYSTRPLACRGWNSADKARCATDFVTPTAGSPVPVDSLPYRGAAVVCVGLCVGLSLCDLPSPRVRMVPAVGIALSDATAEARWLAGEDVFCEAHTQIEQDGEAFQEQVKQEAARIPAEEAQHDTDGRM